MGHHEHFEAGGLIAILAILFSVVGAIVWWLFSRSRGKDTTDQAMPAPPQEQRETSERTSSVAQTAKTELAPEEELLKLLRQRGRPMTQDEIISTLPMVDTQTIAALLESLEKNGLIERYWSPIDQVFVIRVPTN